MPTTSQQLDDFATAAEAGTVWTLDLQQQLMDLIREPAMTLLGQTIPPLNRSSAMDNIYRCKPQGWVRAEQELPPGQGAVAGFSLWQQNPGETFMGLKMEVGIQKSCATLALAMLAATARVWAYILRQAGR
jgi:hypothetical protein